MSDFDPKVDVRPTIAHGRHYDPRRREHEPTPFVEYPKWVRLPDKREFIANSRAEEEKILGIIVPPAKSVTVDIANLAKPEAVVVSKPRGRPRKEVVELPKNLD